MYSKFIFQYTYHSRANNATFYAYVAEWMPGCFVENYVQILQIDLIPNLYGSFMYPPTHKKVTRKLV